MFIHFIMKTMLFFMAGSVMVAATPHWKKIAESGPILWPELKARGVEPACRFEEFKGPVKDKGGKVEGGKMGIDLDECKELCNAKSECRSFVYQKMGKGKDGKKMEKKGCYLKDKELIGTEKPMRVDPSFFSVRKICKEVHCEWNDWQMEECSKTCGGGTRTNHRTKKTEEANGGTCDGQATMEDVCNTEVCPPIHCEWDDWAEGECSATCGTGTKTNTRVKSVEEANDGTCSGQATAVVTCNPNPCPIDCLWDEWQMGICDKPCGGGFRTDERVRKVDVEHGGQECTGESTLTESCNVQECPVHCEWNGWMIGPCSVTCGGGIQTDSREHWQEAEYDGNPCEGEATREVECNNVACPAFNYVFSAGCEHGNDCSTGKFCGAWPNDQLCSPCSFEECLQLAYDNSVFSFSYRGTQTTWCRQCSEAQLMNPATNQDWGIYVRGMCTGTFVESDPIHWGERPSAGTKCVAPCVNQSGRWGSTFCFTNNDEQQWGAECVTCPAD